MKYPPFHTSYPAKKHGDKFYLEYFAMYHLGNFEKIKRKKSILPVITPGTFDLASLGVTGCSWCCCNGCVTLDETTTLGLLFRFCCWLCAIDIPGNPPLLEWWLAARIMGCEVGGCWPTTPPGCPKLCKLLTPAATGPRECDPFNS